MKLRVGAPHWVQFDPAGVGPELIADPEVAKSFLGG
jgi:hypothetical protein